MSDSVIGQIFYQNLGGFATGTAVSYIVCTLTGPFSQSVTIPAGQQNVTFGPGMIFGQYSYTLQAFDVNGNQLGPTATGIFWYNPYPNEFLPLPQSAAIEVTA